MTGLRELKKQRTREAIQGQALRLIRTQGYDATTCEQIAAAADISSATLFRYFPTKEDMVLQDVYDPLIAQAVRARPAAERPLVAARRGLADALAMVYEADVEQIRERTRLILSIPALRARSREQQQSLVTHLADAFADRTAAPRDDVSVEVIAAVCAAALSAAVERWVRLGGDLPAHVDEAFAVLSRNLGAVSR